MPSTTSILHVNSSGRYEGSHSRQLSAQLVETLKSKHSDAHVVERDVANGVEFVDQAWIESSFTQADARNDRQKERLANSDALVAEVQAADIIVIGAPIYNFSVPAALKAWIDQIARANVTFRYTPEGPVGLLQGKKAYVVVTSGGTEITGAADFASGYMKHVLGFIGIDDVSFITANQLMVDEAAALSTAQRQIAEAA